LLRTFSYICFRVKDSCFKILRLTLSKIFLPNLSAPGLIYTYIRYIYSLILKAKADLFEALLEYAQFGVLPEFDDVGVSVAWDFIQPRIDRDAQAYDLKCLKNQYSVYCREAKKSGQTPIPFDDWKSSYVKLLSIIDGMTYLLVVAISVSDCFFSVTLVAVSVSNCLFSASFCAMNFLKSS